MFFVVAKKRCKRSRPYSKDVGKSNWKKVGEEEKIVSCEKSFQSHRQRRKTSKHQDIKKTHKHSEHSKHSTSSVERKVFHSSHTGIDSSRLEIQSNNLKSSRDYSPKSDTSRSSTPSSHLSLGSSGIKLKRAILKVPNRNAINKIESKEDKWNDFDEMIRRIKSNLSSETYEEDASTNKRTNQCNDIVESPQNVNDKESIQIDQPQNSKKVGLGCQLLNGHLQNRREMTSNYVSENDSEKDLTLRMSDDDAEEEQLKSKQQQDEALIDKVFNHPGIF